MVAAPHAAAPVPPPAITPMKANWEPPVNISALSAQACHTVSPAVTASAPNEMPYMPVATEIASPMRTAGVRRSRRGMGTRSG
ncbi:Hypothetical protein RM25_0652 [Propionibacterium freudenreichii subsp. freudenreichii]|nr:Hypothetical protein RM25_0652 [Propionibacterium freudenreichii subsp. freudenreichii]